MAFQNENQMGIPLGDNFVDFTTRVDKISLETIVDISAKYNCKQEFAGIIHLISTDLNVDPELIVSDLRSELKRLEKIGEEPPEIETYLHKFAISEGKWIAFFRESFPNNLINEGKKIQGQYAKIGKLKGSDLIALATQIMMERQFIAANTIIPVLDKWVEEHKGSTDFEAALHMLRGYFKKQDFVDIIVQMEDAKEHLVKQIQILGDILANAEGTNWVFRALIEAEILHEDLKQNLDDLTNKGVADIILWLVSKSYEKTSGDFTSQEDMSKLIMRFQLESALGIASASPMATLEYELLSLNYKDDMAKSKLADEMIIKTWKEAQIGSSPLETGREILALLMDYSNAPPLFLTKLPKHFGYITEFYASDKLRLARALDRIKIKGKEPTIKEMQNAVILDYLLLFARNYVTGKMKADEKDLEVPDEPKILDLVPAERDIIDMIDAAVQRGIRSKNRAQAMKVLEAQILSMYQRCLNQVKNEVTVGESILYGIYNINGIEITREKARNLILDHFTRMKVSTSTSGKKRIDSVVQKAIAIEIEEKIFKRDIK
ncbi:MAG: hypothetical protein ACTSPM_03395 [Candidatus Heimdallarchaeota archaeon]